ncbi:hypothetical protein ACP6PL_05190 [Dapis sp. BLCC M126]|uniref:hypothetical protein n=1 Tax=Dapis sp. BLCC M126 TaxID=3400189 RepID=UPI003CEBFE42
MFRVKFRYNCFPIKDLSYFTLLFFKSKANNIQTVEGNQNIGNVTQTAGNNATNIQTAGGQQNPGEINQTFGNESINIQKDRVNQNAVDLLVLSACRTDVGDKNAELGFVGLAVAA